MKRKIFVSITTETDWEAKIKETDKLGIEEVSLFPTYLDKGKRKKLYQLLKRSSIKSIPLVHLRNDMELWELDYLIKNYDTKVFNTHMQIECPLLHDLSEYKKIIFIENVYSPFDEKELANFGGICLDLSHLENDRFWDKEKFKHDLEILKKYPIGSNHISAVKKVIRIDSAGWKRYDSHYFKHLSDFDYFKKYPLNYFSKFIAIELENSIKEQLEARDYIINLLKSRV